MIMKEYISILKMNIGQHQNSMDMGHPLVLIDEYFSCEGQQILWLIQYFQHQINY